MWAVFVCFPLFAFCQLFNSSAAQWPVLFRIFESQKQYLLLGRHICVRFANCYFLLLEFIVGLCCDTLYFEMIFVKLRRNNLLTIHWVFSPNQTILKRVRAAFQLKEKNPFLLVLTGRGKAQLKLLLTKKGVGHYWRRNQKLPTMGSKTVDREEEEVQMGAKKLAKLVQKTGDRWAGRDQKSASREEVNSAWMGLLIEATICVCLSQIRVAAFILQRKN